MKQEFIKFLLLLGLAGFVCYIIFLRAGTISALILFPFYFFLFYSLSSLEKSWDSLKIILNPFLFSIISFFLGFSFYSLLANPLNSSLIFGAGSLLVGGVFSTLVYKYWHIGD